MRVGILGLGLMGGKLGTIFARAGHEVVFSYARRREKLEEPAEQLANAEAFRVTREVVGRSSNARTRKKSYDSDAAGLQSADAGASATVAAVEAS